MRRWNGWGDASITMDLPHGGLDYLVERCGHARAFADADFDDVCNRIGPSRLPGHRLVYTDAATRLRHARGQSIPDMLAMRSGRPGRVPDGVAFPETRAEVAELLSWARRNGVVLIPYGGGTSVVGHINAPATDAPVLTISLARMTRLIDIDLKSNLATFGAGATGPLVEAQLVPYGKTLGHFPQSFEYSTIGGWVATRSSGQQSLRYGKIEQMFAGASVETFDGRWDIPAFPATSAGPDLREIVLGSEGRFGIITEVTVRIYAKPERESFYTWFFPDWESGHHAARELVQQRTPLSMIRLSNERETESQLKLAGHERAVSALRTYLRMRGTGTTPCMMTVGITGTQRQWKLAACELRRVLRRHGGVSTGTVLGKKWRKNRFRTPYLRERLWEDGYLVDTLETATNWDNVTPMMHGIENALQGAVEGERIHAFTHLSHVYTQGCSVYTTYVFRVASTFEETYERWHALKDAASRYIVENRGTISHQHGVGQDHAPYLAVEKGDAGMEAIRALDRHFNPQALLNPGTLIPVGVDNAATGAAGAASKTEAPAEHEVHAP